MGYRSDGAFRARGEPDKLFAVISKLRLTYSDQAGLKEALSDCKLVDNLFGFDFSGWKWYSSYSEVAALEAIMEEFRKDESFDTSWIRIGEENGDIEEDFSGSNSYDLVRLMRSIDSEDFPVGSNVLSSIID